MSTRRVVIDDSDSLIQYSGSGWFTAAGQDSLGNDGPTYLGSQHGLKGNGGFIFTFEGTSIELYGTNGQVPSSDAYDPKWGCHVDGQAVSGRSGASDVENNWPLCAGDGFSAGAHQLVVDVTGTGEGTFWFDRLMYTPSGTPPTGSVLWVDATEDSAFQYDSTWHSSGVMVTAVHGGSVSFSFTGSGLTWVGEIPDHSDISPASLTYTIDGANAATVQMTGRATASSPTQSNHVFFSTSDISSGSHTIKVTYNGDSNTPLTAGYVYVRDEATGTVSSASTSDSGSGQSSNSAQAFVASSTSPVGLFGSSVTLASPSASVSSPPSSSPSLNSLSLNLTSPSPLVSGSGLSPQQTTLISNSLSTPASTNLARPSSSQEAGVGMHGRDPWIIVAAVLGGLVLIVLILFLIFMRRRRQRQLGQSTANTELTPFTTALMPNNDSMVKLNTNTRRLSLVAQNLPTEHKSAAGRMRESIVSLGAPPSYTR